MQIKTLPIQTLDLKFAGEGMQFSGYASVFGLVDSYGDTIAPGAYKDTLQGRERPIRMRWNHYGPVIGKWIRIEEDTKGLYVEGELTPGHRVAIDTYASLKHGAVDGMSIGYTADQSHSNADGIRVLEKIGLMEISVVEEPADLGARVAGIKAASTIREIEAALRDSGGFSRADAQTLVSRIKSMLQGELAAEEKARQEIAALFQRYS
jgi:HK97 family phage prohead protease